MAQLSVFIRRLLPRLGPAHLWAFNGTIVILCGLGIGVWSASRPEQVPSFYIVRWNQSGKCSVTIEPPATGDFRLIWHGNLRLSANEKIKEFIQVKRCR